MKQENVEFPLLSILVAAYNIEQYISACIDSLLSQTYPNVEIIVVNDGSKDLTGKILQQYADQSKITLINQPNGGTSSARNKALSYASGEYVTFFDGDDTIAADTYMLNMHYLMEDEEIDCVSFPIMYEWTTGNEVVNIPDETVLFSKKDIFRHYLQQDLTFSMCDKIYRRSALTALRFIEGIRYEDVDSNCQVVQSIRKIRLSNLGLYYYRRTPNSNITSRMEYQKMADYFRVTFSFLHQAQQAGVNSLFINKYIARWLRLKFFLLYPRFSEAEKLQLSQYTTAVRISKISLVKELFLCKLSIKKFRALWVLSNQDIYQAIWISNSKYDRNTFLESYDKHTER